MCFIHFLVCGSFCRKSVLSVVTGGGSRACWEEQPCDALPCVILAQFFNPLHPCCFISNMLTCVTWPRRCLSALKVHDSFSILWLNEFYTWNSWKHLACCFFLKQRLFQVFPSTLPPPPPPPPPLPSPSFYYVEFVEIPGMTTVFRMVK